MTFSRTNPSPRYQELLEYYREMHEHGADKGNIPPLETFSGMTMPHAARMIQGVIRVLGSKTILDYGSGKGRQYEPLEITGPDNTIYPDIKSFWAVDSITCYDPGFPKFETLPEKRFEGVIATDILEHCPGEDVPWIVEEIFSFAEEFVFLCVACYPAFKTLPNGENAHCTVEAPEWWQDLFDRTLASHPGLRYFAALETATQDPGDNSNPISRQIVTGKCKS